MQESEFSNQPPQNTTEKEPDRVLDVKDSSIDLNNSSNNLKEMHIPELSSSPSSSLAKVMLLAMQNPALKLPMTKPPSTNHYKLKSLHIKDKSDENLTVDSNFTLSSKSSTTSINTTLAKGKYLRQEKRISHSCNNPKPDSDPSSSLAKVLLLSKQISSVNIPGKKDMGIKEKNKQFLNKNSSIMTKPTATKLPLPCKNKSFVRTIPSKTNLLQSRKNLNLDKTEKRFSLLQNSDLIENKNIEKVIKTDFRPQPNITATPLQKNPIVSESLPLVIQNNSCVLDDNDKKQSETSLTPIKILKNDTIDKFSTDETEGKKSETTLKLTPIQMPVDVTLPLQPTTIVEKNQEGTLVLYIRKNTENITKDQPHVSIANAAQFTQEDITNSKENTSEIIKTVNDGMRTHTKLFSKHLATGMHKFGMGDSKHEEKNTLKSDTKDNIFQKIVLDELKEGSFFKNQMPSKSLTIFTKTCIQKIITKEDGKTKKSIHTTKEKITINIFFLLILFITILFFTHLIISRTEDKPEHNMF